MNKGKSEANLIWRNEHVEIRIPGPGKKENQAWNLDLLSLTRLTFKKGIEETLGGGQVKWKDATLNKFPESEFNCFEWMKQIHQSGVMY